MRNATSHTSKPIMFGGSDTITTDWLQVRAGSSWDIGELGAESCLPDTTRLWAKKGEQSNTPCKDSLDAMIHGASLTLSQKLSLLAIFCALFLPDQYD